MSLPFLTYMLRCADGSYYVGHTDDLERRIAEHHAAEIPGYTSTRLPVSLVWSETFATRDEALIAERQIKGWSRAKKEALIAGDWTAIARLASRAKILRDGDEPSTGSVSPPPRDEWTGGRIPPSPPPLIVLVRPQLGENIGKAVRAMANFGLAELRLVAPRDGWPNPAAGPAAAGADEVLERARVFDTLAEAVADCPHVYATTVRKRGVTKPVVTPEQAALEIHAAQGRSAIVFGPERSGLETEEVALARTILTVPVNPDFASLNLAQAVILCAYEWSKHQSLAMPPKEDLLPPAPQDELEGMIAHFETLLDARNYFFPHSRAVATRLTLRTMLTKPGWNHLEVRTMRGVLSALAKEPRKP